MSAIEVALLDEQYDGALTAMALSGGRATLSQLERFLGGATARQAFLQTMISAGHIEFDERADRYPVRSQGVTLSIDALAALLGEGQLLTPALQPHQIYDSVFRFEHLLKFGRPLHRLLDCDPAFICPEEDARTRAWRAGGRALFRTQHAYVDLSRDGPALVTVDYISWVFGWWTLLDALPHLVTALAERFQWRILTPSPYQTGRLRWVLDLMRDQLPEGVSPRIVEWDLARHFVEPEHLADLSRDVFGLPPY